MSLPITLAQILTDQRHAELLAQRTRRRSARRPGRLRRLKRWAQGWFDRAVPGSAGHPHPSK
jgi:hypothetical protein